MYRENALDPATLFLSFPKEKKEIKKERKNFLLTHIKSFPFLLKKKEETRTKTKTNTRRDKIPFFLLSEIGSFESSETDRRRRWFAESSDSQKSLISDADSRRISEELLRKENVNYAAQKFHRHQLCVPTQY